jgi:predicted RNase H-like HicB family nuclease
MTIDELVGEPWTFCGPVESIEAGEKCYKMTIEELPGFVALGATRYEVVHNLFSVLRVFLAASLENGIEIRLPERSH